MEYTVALTGATGFIGNRIARRLAANGCKLQALARATSDRSRLSGFNIHWVEGALEDPDSLRRLVHGADAVVHCAAAVRGATQAHFERLNVDGAARLVRAAVEQHPSPRFLLISSLAAREPELSYYAASKRKAETVIAEQAGSMPWAVLRPPAVYGPGDKEMLPLLRWMARGIAFVVGSGNARISMLYVDDLADAVQRWLLKDALAEKVFELHDGQPAGYSWQDVIDTIEHLTGKRVRSVKVPFAVLKTVSSLNLHAARIFRYAPMFTPGKLRELRHPDWVCENGAFARETGWTPQVSLQEGLRRTLQL
ncbi:MAG: NAD(P)-dependent oxidoreductase [Desulfobacterales bacterium]|jgi:nucleoside-diphosphate-sugar epimerase